MSPPQVERGWLSEIDDLYGFVETVERTVGKVDSCPWAITRMIGLFKDQLKLVKAARKTMEFLKQSKLYSIENGIVPPDQLRDQKEASFMSKVSSKNQQGGITAGTVHIGSISTEASYPDSARKKTIWSKIAGLVFIFAALVAVFEYIGLNPFKAVTSEKSGVGEKRKIFVESKNQSGGITAGIVNINSGDSHRYMPLSEKRTKEVTSSLGKFKRVYSKVPIHIQVEVESGSRERHRVASILGEILSNLELGRFDGTNTYMGQAPVR